MALLPPRCVTSGEMAERACREAQPSRREPLHQQFRKLPRSNRDQGSATEAQLLSILAYRLTCFIASETPFESGSGHRQERDERPQMCWRVFPFWSLR